MRTGRKVSKRSAFPYIYTYIIYIYLYRYRYWEIDRYRYRYIAVDPLLLALDIVGLNIIDSMLSNTQHPANTIESIRIFIIYISIFYFLYIYIYMYIYICIWMYMWEEVIPHINDVSFNEIWVVRKWIELFWRL